MMDEINKWVPIDQETWNKWKNYVEDNYHPDWFEDHGLNLPEEVRKLRIIKGHVAQELIAKWINDIVPYDVEVNLEIGKDKHDTDIKRGKPDVMINGKKIDIKIAKVLRQDFKEYDIILVAEFIDEPGIKGYEIQGYWKTKELDIDEMDLMPGGYLLPRKRFSKIRTLHKALK